jgi:hypothetical protein
MIDCITFKTSKSQNRQTSWGGGKMRNVLAILTAFVLFGISFHLSSCKSCKNKPADRGGDGKVSSPDQNPSQAPAQKSNQPPAPGSNQNSNPAPASEVLTPEELEKEKGIKRRIMGMARENMRLANQPWEQALAKANDGFVRAVLAKDGATVAAARGDVKAVFDEVCGVPQGERTLEAELICREIAIIKRLTDPGILPRHVSIHKDDHLECIGHLAEIITDLIVKNSDLLNVQDYLRRKARAKLALVEMRWLLQVAQEAAKTGNPKSVELRNTYVRNIEEYILRMQALANENT